jgi:hypothetical protein
MRTGLLMARLALAALMPKLVVVAVAALILVGVEVVLGPPTLHWLAAAMRR